MEKIAKKVIFVVSAAIVALPAFHEFATLFPYTFPIAIFFRVGVEICAIAWIALLLQRKAPRPQWKDPITFFLTAWMGVLLVTLLASVDWQRSFFSHQASMTGVFTLLHVWAWFLILRSNIHELRVWRILFFISSVPILALVFDYFRGVEQGFSMTPTLEGPIQFGSYAVLVIFLSLFLFCSEKSKYWKDAMISLIFFSILALFFSGARGPGIALVISVFFFLTLLSLFAVGQQRRTARLFLMGVFFSICVGVFIANFFSFSGSAEKIAQGFRPKEYFERIALWTIGLKGFIEKPLLGWGWENFDKVYDRFVEPTMLGVSMPDTFVDRSKNHIVDVLSLTGIIGFLFYIFWWLAIFVVLYKAVKKESDPKQRIALLALTTFFFSYGVVHLASSLTPAALIILCIPLAYVSQKATESKNENHAHAVHCSENGRAPMSFLAKCIIFGTVCGAAASIYFFHSVPFFESRDTYRAITLMQKEYETALKLFKKALAKHSFTNVEARNNLASSIVARLSEGRIVQDADEKGIRLALTYLEKGIEETPLLYQPYVLAAELYRRSTDGSDQKKALETIQKAQALSPGRLTPHYQIAETYALQKKYIQAIDAANAAIALDPHNGKTHYVASLQYARAGEFEKAFTEVEKAYAQGYSVFSDNAFPKVVVEKLIHNFPPKGKHDLFLRVIEKAVEDQPSYVDYKIARIILYSLAGNKKKADQLLIALVHTDSDAALRAQSFLNSKKAKNKVETGEK